MVNYMCQPFVRAKQCVNRHLQAAAVHAQLDRQVNLRAQKHPLTEVSQPMHCVNYSAVQAPFNMPIPDQHQTNAIRLQMPSAAIYMLDFWCKYCVQK
jgi:hypothetical protein